MRRFIIADFEGRKYGSIIKRGSVKPNEEKVSEFAKKANETQFKN